MDTFFRFHRSLGLHSRGDVRTVDQQHVAADAPTASAAPLANPNTRVFARPTLQTALENRARFLAEHRLLRPLPAKMQDTTAPADGAQDVRGQVDLILGPNATPEQRAKAYQIAQTQVDQVGGIGDQGVILEAIPGLIAKPLQDAGIPLVGDARVIRAVTSELAEQATPDQRKAAYAKAQQYVDEVGGISSEGIEEEALPQKIHELMLETDIPLRDDRDPRARDQAKAALKTVYEMMPYDADASWWDNDDAAFREWAGDEMKAATAWPLSQLFGGVLDSAMLGDDPSRIREVSDELQKYKDDDGAYQPSLGDSQKYYDDNAWIGLDYIQAYRQTKDKSYLDKAKEIAPFMEKGIQPDGGILWRTDDDNNTFNTCANAPAMQYFLNLYKETGDVRYLNDAKKIEPVLNDKLRLPNGLYRDNISASDPNRGPDDTIYSYNQGAAVGANLQMADAVTDPAEKERYLALAKQTGEAVLEKMSQDPDWLWKQPPAFNAVMFRNLLKLGATTGDNRYRKVLDDYLARADKEAKNPANGAYELGGIGRYDGKATGIALIDQSAFGQMFALRGMSKGQLLTVS